jgi:hypothetical protein
MTLHLVMRVERTLPDYALCPLGTHRDATVQEDDAVSEGLRRSQSVLIPFTTLKVSVSSAKWRILSVTCLTFVSVGRGRQKQKTRRVGTQ